MNRHAFIPSPAAPQRTLFIRTRRTWWQRLAPALVLAAVALAFVGMVLSTAALIARLHATDAALDAAHAQGMAVGLRSCPQR